ncbi:hypothetical protein ACFWF4_32235, partial [Nocardiopsis flavescens]|uniref:hypothetical protein n=1 Tax=Nocardiopsis flavescens TaxID=758803 RepID=UPI00365C15E6
MTDRTRPAGDPEPHSPAVTRRRLLCSAGAGALAAALAGLPSGTALASRGGGGPRHRAPGVT